MTLKTMTAALALILTPTLSLAQERCSGNHGEQTAMSCAEGMMIDAETGECVPIVTG